MKNFVIGMLLIVISTLIGLVIAEFTLRIFFPKYQYAAESNYELNSIRIQTPSPNKKNTRKHPDSKKYHPLIYNNLALHQHRNFIERDLETAVNIGFFGDSMTNNRRLPAPFGFSEVLDFLLNSHERQRFNILNFGVDGYGTRQSYLYYAHSELSSRLKHVFYVVNSNDLRNIYENGLFSVSDSGRLVKHPALKSPWWIRIISRFYLTYLVIDYKNGLFRNSDGDLRLLVAKIFHKGGNKEERKSRYHSPRADAIQTAWKSGQENTDLEHGIKIFTLLLEEWRQKAESNGAKFYVVLLPKARSIRFKDIIDADFNIIDLYEIFRDSIVDYKFKTHCSFKRDPHWGERCNMQTALHLNRFLESELQLSPIPQDQLTRFLHTYYSAFDYGWRPEFSIPFPPASQKDILRIRNKYIPLELEEDN